MLRILDSGEVVDAPGARGLQEEMAAAREQTRAELATAARALIAQAEDIDKDAAEVFARVNGGRSTPTALPISTGLCTREWDRAG